MTSIKSLKQRSEQQERDIAKGYREAGFPHAKRQAMSGALRVLPGDVDPGSLLLVEAKETRTGRLVIKPDWLLQVREQARNMGRAGFYALHAWLTEGEKNYLKVVIVDEALWFAVLEKWNKDNAEA